MEQICFTVHDLQINDSTVTLHSLDVTTLLKEKKKKYVLLYTYHIKFGPGFTGYMIFSLRTMSSLCIILIPNS